MHNSRIVGVRNNRSKLGPKDGLSHERACDASGGSWQNADYEQHVIVESWPGSSHPALTGAAAACSQAVFWTRAYADTVSRPEPNWSQI